MADATTTIAAPQPTPSAGTINVPGQASGAPSVAPGLINTAPPTGSTASNAPGATPNATVASYTPSTASSTNANVTPYTVPANATVASQLAGIINSGSPLMEEASANAMNTANERGLINSSMAAGAGQAAMIAAAEPIAAADAGTFATAATNTGNAANAANQQNAQLATSTSQYNAGQTNAALSAGASAENAQSLQAQQNAAALAQIKANGTINQQITAMQDDNKLLLQNSQGAQAIYSQGLTDLANIIINPNLSEDQKNTALNDVMAQIQDGLNVMSQISNTPDVASTLDFSSNPTGPLSSNSAEPAIPAAAMATAGLGSGTGGVPAAAS